MAMIRKLKRILGTLKKDFNLKMEDYGSMEILYNEEVGYLVHFFREKRNLGPSHLKKLVEHLKKEVKKAFKDKNVKDLKIIIVLGTKLTRGALDIINDIIKNQGVYVLELPTKTKFDPGNEDPFFNSLAETLNKIKII